MGVSYIELDKLPSPEVLASVEDRCNQVVRMFMMMIMMMLILTMMVIAMILVIVSDGCNQLNRISCPMTLERGEKLNPKSSINLFQR